MRRKGEGKEKEGGKRGGLLVLVGRCAAGCDPVLGWGGKGVVSRGGREVRGWGLDRGEDRNGRKSQQGRREERKREKKKGKAGGEGERGWWRRTLTKSGRRKGSPLISPVWGSRGEGACSVSTKERVFWNCRGRWGESEVE